MNNDNCSREHLRNQVGWEIAYTARELRQKGSATFRCNQREANIVLEKLSLFSNSKPIMANSFTNPISNNEIFLEIINF